MLFLVYIGTIAVPWQSYMIPQFILLSNAKLSNTLWAIILLQAFGAFGVFLMKQYYETIPEELSEAARLDGLSEYGIWRRIMLPLSIPALASLTLLTFVNTWNDYLGPLIYLRNPDLWTIQLGLKSFVSNLYDTNYALLFAGLTHLGDADRDHLHAGAEVLRRGSGHQRDEGLSAVKRISHNTYATVFAVVYLGLMTNALLLLGCLPLVVLLVTTDPATSWPLLAVAAPLCAPSVAAAFTVFRDHSRGGTQVARAFFAAWRAVWRKALALGAMASALLVVVLVDVRAVAASGDQRGRRAAPRRDRPGRPGGRP